MIETLEWWLSHYFWIGGALGVITAPIFSRYMWDDVLKHRDSEFASTTRAGGWGFLGFLVMGSCYPAIILVALISAIIMGLGHVTKPRKRIREIKEEAEKARRDRDINRLEHETEIVPSRRNHPPDILIVTPDPTDRRREAWHYYR